MLTAPAMWRRAMGYGAYFEDDFGGGGTTTPVSSGRWIINTIGAAPTYALAAPGDANAIGVKTLTTSAVNGEGGSISRGSTTSPELRHALFVQGALWEARVSLTNNTDVDTWIGFHEAAATVPTASSTLKFIGYRAMAGVGAVNWFGGTKNGADPSETFVDSGQIADSTKRWLGMLRTSTGWQLVVDGVAVGAVITTNLIADTQDLLSVLGIVTRAVATKELSIDCFRYFSPLRRY